VNHVDIDADSVRAEVGDRTDPEWLAGAAMCLVQARVRGWREKERVSVGKGFTDYAPDILATGSGYCGSAVIAWRAILDVLGIQTRRVEFSWGEVGHACAEAFWNERWHFFDIQNGTLWINEDQVLGWDQVRLNPDEKAMRVSNAAWVRYSGYEPWFAADPFAYLTVKTCVVKVVP
jgi:hypothetical protein